MSTSLLALASRSFFVFDPETAHGLSILALKSGLVPVFPPKPDPRLAVNLAGLQFANPLGLAAGYDKNAQVADAVLRLGFSFVEVGTLTPKPQPGNPKPRIFRLIEDRAVINRLGFNNGGHDAAFQRLSARSGRPGIVGVNIGANKDSSDRIGDYVAGIRRFQPIAGYFAVNISSPNTPGLRDLQARDNLRALLEAVLTARREEAEKHGRNVPVFLKIAPDLDETALDDIAAEALSQSLDGLIVSNTTLSRDGVGDRSKAQEAGGLSGAPLFDRATAVLARMRKRLGPDFPLIGVGGVEDTETVLEKIRAGADLVQIYSGLVYGGPGLPAQILRALSAFVEREKLGSIRELRDLHVDDWSSRPL